MTQPKFETWVEEHYGELTAVARRLVNNPADAAEVVHDAVVGVLATGSFNRIKAPWTRMVLAVQGAARNRRRSTARKSLEAPDPIKFGKGDKPGASPRRLLKMKKLTPEQNAERWVHRNYLKQLERERVERDMDGYGRKQTLQGSNGHPDEAVGSSGRLDPKFTVRYPHEDDPTAPAPCYVTDANGNLLRVEVRE